MTRRTSDEQVPSRTRSITDRPGSGCVAEDPACLILSSSSPSALTRAAGAPVTLERPVGRDTRRLRDERRAAARRQDAPPPREIAEELAERRRALDGVARADGRRARLRQPRARRRVVRARRSRACSRQDDGFGGGSAAAPERVQVEMVSANPTGPMTVAAARNGAYGDCVARLLAFAGHTVEREYYYNDAGGADGPLPRVGRRGAARRGAARGRLPRRLHRRARARSRRSRAGMLELIEASLERFRIQLRHVRAAERGRDRDAGGDRAARHVRGGRRAVGADVRPRRREGPRARPLRRQADVLRRRRRLRAAQVRARLRPAGLRARGRPPRLRRPAAGAGGDARPSARLARGADLPARPPDKGGEATKMSKRRGDVVFLDDFIDEIGVDAARWYLVSRGHDQTIDIDVDLAAEKIREEPRLLRPVRARPDRRASSAMRRRSRRRRAAVSRWPARSRPRSAISSSASLEFPGVAAEAAERRAPHAIPTYAIRLADDFHRFYHHHKVLGSPQEALPARPVHRDEDGRRPLPRPRRGRGAGPHVSAAGEHCADPDALEPGPRRPRGGVGADRRPRRGRRSTRRRSRSCGSRSRRSRSPSSRSRRQARAAPARAAPP